MPNNQEAERRKKIIDTVLIIGATIFLIISLFLLAGEILN